VIQNIINGGKVDVFADWIWASPFKLGIITETCSTRFSWRHTSLKVTTLIVFEITAFVLVSIAINKWVGFS